MNKQGSRRDPNVDVAVLEATKGLLVERGYAGTSIDAIASRAGVGRPTIYRRWPSKAHVVHDAVYPSIEPEALSGDDVLAWMSTIVEGAFALFGQPHARAGVPGLIAETRSDSGLREKLIVDQLEPIRLALRGTVDRGIQSGVFREDVDLDSLIDVIAGTAIFALSVRDESDPSARARDITRMILQGISA